jgi:electron transfer flavoprotein alpha subunit
MRLILQTDRRQPMMWPRRRPCREDRCPVTMRIAVLIKQVPDAETLELLPNGRIRREGVELEMNAYCRRAVTKGVELAAATGGSCTVVTLGPPSAEEVLREAVAWGADEGVLITDPAFAGSDTLATASALAAALRNLGELDLVLVGRNSVDADTGQVGPELAELLDLPFIAAARELDVTGRTATARCELDDGWRTVQVVLPAVVSVAERLCQPAKVPADRRAGVAAERLRRLSAAALGPAPWGESASRTVVRETRPLDGARKGIVLCGPPAQQVTRVIELLTSWDMLPGQGGVARDDAVSRAVGPSGDSHHADSDDSTEEDTSSTSPGRDIAVLAESGQDRVTRELLGEASRHAAVIGGEVVVVSTAPGDPAKLWEYGADQVVTIAGAEVEEDFASATAGWCEAVRPWAVLAPGTLWGREVAGRVAARLRAGLTGDAVELEVRDGRLVCWKPAFGGRLVAAIRATSDIQLATVRPGVLPLLPPRASCSHVRCTVLRARARHRVSILSEHREDHVGDLLAAKEVVAIGAGINPDEYAQLAPLLQALGGELAATRKVTDRSWLPRARQVGLTAHSLTPDLYLTLGVSGKFNHMVGTRGARTIVAVNTDPAAPVFDWADLGMVADWHDVVPLLAEAFTDLRRDGDLNSSRGHSCRGIAATNQLCELVRARLTAVTPCPGRPGYRELRFSVQGRSFTWCFPGAAEELNVTGNALVLSPGSQGLMAEVIGAETDVHPRGVSPSVAAALAISGLPVLIHASLVQNSSARPAGQDGVAARHA